MTSIKNLLDIFIQLKRLEVQYTYRFLSWSNFTIFRCIELERCDVFSQKDSVSEEKENLNKNIQTFRSCENRIWKSFFDNLNLANACYCRLILLPSPPPKKQNKSYLDKEGILTLLSEQHWVVWWWGEGICFTFFEMLLACKRTLPLRIARGRNIGVWWLVSKLVTNPYILTAHHFNGRACLVTHYIESYSNCLIVKLGNSKRNDFSCFVQIQ